jgi:hypothetical protein
MTAQENPFVRVYYSIIDDEKFATVYADDRRLATWLRLLIAADAMYPAPAPVPRACHAPTLAHLVGLRLVELVGAEHFRVVGLAKERSGRYAGGRGRKQYPSDTNSESESGSESGGTPVRRNLTRPDQTSQSRPDQTDDADALDTYHELTGWRPWGQFSGDALKGAIRDYTDAATSAALRAEAAVDGDRGTLLKRALTRLAREADRHLEEAKRKPRKPRAADDPATRKAVNAEMMALYAQKEPS